MRNNKVAWPYPNIVAHRGAGKYAPENTLASMRMGAENGHKMVEFDVTLSSDDVAFLLHDATLNRTANYDAQASKTTWGVLSKLDAGSWHSPAFTSEPLPSLAQIAELTRELNLAVNIEIKPAPRLEQHTGRLIAQDITQLFDSHPLPPLVSSFSFAALQAVHKIAPKLFLGYLMHEWQEDWLEKVSAIKTDSAGCIALHLNHLLINPERIDAIKNAGFFIFVYTVNDKERANYLLSIGVDAICTDEIFLIRP